METKIALWLKSPRIEPVFELDFKKWSVVFMRCHPQPRDQNSFWINVWRQEFRTPPGTGRFIAKRT